MEERLRSRFSWGGLIADIQPPSTEEKTAILMKRAEFMGGLKLPGEVALFIADNMLTENVRELMGALVRLSAFASFHKRSLTIDLAKEALEKFIVRKDRVITSDEIVNSVCKYFNVKLADLRSKKSVQRAYLSQDR